MFIDAFPKKNRLKISEYRHLQHVEKEKKNISLTNSATKKKNRISE